MYVCVCVDSRGRKGGGRGAWEEKQNWTVGVYRWGMVLGMPVVVLVGVSLSIDMTAETGRAGVGLEFASAIGSDGYGCSWLVRS